MPNLLTVKETATIYKKSPKTIRSWIHDGTLQAIVLHDGTYLIPETAIKSCMRNARPDYDIISAL
jgi:predicted site-specific integrase-resolvase